MREIQLPLNQTQKIRLQRALDKLDSLSSKATAVTIADTIPVNLQEGYLKGHGTVELDGELVASWCGVLDRVNKLCIVHPFRSRYKPETGDIIVGRVIEVSQKRWRIDINANQDAVLMLSSVTLPDGIQRRRTHVDELNMRSIFEENDVLSAEVRNPQGDGTVQLQARSEKYGKLERGQLIIVPSYLVKRSKQHFLSEEEHEVRGVLLILGLNGYVWVGEHSEAKETQDKASTITALNIRQNICRVANTIRVLSTLGFSITVEVVKRIYTLSISMNVEIHDMLGAEFCVLVAEKEAETRSSEAKRKR